MRSRVMPHRLAVLALCLGLTALACGGSARAQEADPAAEPAYEGPNPDPWERFNRAMFRFNRALDRAILRPVARGYVNITPEPVRKGVSNVFSNVAMPINIVNSLLQGKLRQSAAGTGRFLVNTTVGVLGIFDVATGMGLEPIDEDLGQTLAVWGIEDGPYLVLPLLGPSTLRDGLGLAGDFWLDPVTYIDDREVRWTVRGVRAVDTRAALLPLDRTIDSALDPYIFVRDAYLQRRQFLIHDGDPPLDDLYDIEPPD